MGVVGSLLDFRVPTGFFPQCSQCLSKLLTRSSSGAPTELHFYPFPLPKILLL